MVIPEAQDAVGDKEPNDGIAIVTHDGTVGGRALFMAFAAALALRLIFVFETSDVPVVRHLIGDAAGYVGWAQRISCGDWIGSESFYQAPLYPYVIAIINTIFRESVSTLRIVQAVWGALSVVLLMFATGRLFGRRAALVSGVMMASFAPAIFFDGIVQKTSLACVLLCALLAAMAWSSRDRSRWRLLVVGATLGLLCLTRENALIWVPVMILWCWAEMRGDLAVRRLRAVMWFMFGLTIVLVPVGVRNAAVSGEWSLTTVQFGPNFYIGNGKDADGRYRPLVRGHETPEFERHDATELAQQAMSRNLSPQEVSAYWTRRAVEDIRAAPTRWLTLMARKSAMVVNAYEVGDAESIYVYGNWSRLLRRLGSVWHFGVLVPLAALGLMLTWSQRRRLWVYYALIVTMAGSVVAFYILARYRFPLVPLLVPFAAAGCVEAWGRVRRLGFRAVRWHGASAVIVAIAANVPVHDTRRLDAMAQMNVGVALAQADDLSGATTAFELAVLGYPESAEANNNLAQTLALRGDYDRAVGCYERALAANPSLMGVHYNLAVAQERTGHFAEALRQYERALELDPSDDDARDAVSRLRAGG